MFILLIYIYIYLYLDSLSTRCFAFSQVVSARGNVPLLICGGGELRCKLVNLLFSRHARYPEKAPKTRWNCRAASRWLSRSRNRGAVLSSASTSDGNEIANSRYVGKERGGNYRHFSIFRRGKLLQQAQHFLESSTDRESSDRRAATDVNYWNMERSIFPLIARRYFRNFPRHPARESIRTLVGTLYEFIVSYTLRIYSHYNLFYIIHEFIRIIYESNWMRQIYCGNWVNRFMLWIILSILIILSNETHNIIWLKTIQTSRDIWYKHVCMFLRGSWF